MFAEVLLEVSIGKLLDYAIPQGLVASIVPGVLVRVPLRNHLSNGYVVSIKPVCNVASPLPITCVLSDGPIITEDLFRLAVWMSRYYAVPLERILKSMLPAGVRKDISTRCQYLVTRAMTRNALACHVINLRHQAPAQAKALEILLKVKGGILLSQLAEEALCSPSVIKGLAEKGLVQFDIVRTDHPILYGEKYFPTIPKPLLEEQQKAFDVILASLTAEQFSVKLLFGITGSGKTEVYMHAINAALKLKKGILVLIPEIALTMQTIQRFRSRFDIPIAVLHHRLSDGERRETWDEIRKGRRRLVVGARSAIFSPIPNLGLIIIDEEHEHSYKQSDDVPTYHARDIGVMRGKLTNATVVLGSATPSLESYHNAKIQKYELLTLSKRPSEAILPKVYIVDMRKEWDKSKGITFFSELLLDKIHQRIKQGEQTILFLNRRGYHTTSTCMQCNTVIKCVHCDSSLTFHKSHHILSCHLCGMEIPPPEICPNCKSRSMMKYTGVGTEKIEAMLRGIFGNLRTLRADADSTRHKGALEKVLLEFRTGKADVMIGTQMIAKGLHFPEVTLVGVLNCDASLNIPDFRAQESVFQLITQVAGRAGRGVNPGEVILQTRLPSHPTILAAAEQNYEPFFQEEIITRKLFNFPPYTHIVKFIFYGLDEHTVQAVATSWVETLQKHLSSHFMCHPALPCGHAKMNDRYRYQCLIRGPNVTTITALTEQLDRTFKLPHGVQRFCDVDPTSTFF